MGDGKITPLHLIFIYFLFLHISALVKGVICVFFFIMMVPFLNAPNPPLPSSHRGAITSVYRLQTFNHYLPIEVRDKLPGTLNIFRLSHKTQHIESQAAQIVEHQYYVINKSYDKLHGITSTHSKTALSSLSCLPCQGTASLEALTGQPLQA